MLTKTSNCYCHTAALNSYTMASGDVLTVKQDGNSIFMSTSGGNESWTTAIGTIENGVFTVTTDDGQTLTGEAFPISGMDLPQFGISKQDPRIEWGDGTTATSNTDTLVNTRVCESPTATLALTDWTSFGPCVMQTDGTWAQTRERFCHDSGTLHCDADCASLLTAAETMAETDAAACSSITTSNVNDWTDVIVNGNHLLNNIDSNGEVQIKYISDFLSKDEAQARCVEEGAIMMPIETQEDMDVVMTTAELCTYKPIWQPLSDAVTENDFLIDVSKM